MNTLSNIEQELNDMGTMTEYLCKNIESVSPMLQVKFLEATLKFCVDVKPIYIAALTELAGKE